MTRKKFYAVQGVPIAELMLDPENARIRVGADQADCIEKILRKESQLLNLMRDVSENGLSTMPILVSKNDEQKWVVRDGNRRVTALKLLNDPDLAPSDHIRSVAKTLADKHPPPQTVDCLGSDDDEAMLQELLVRHSGTLDGVGQLTWEAYLRVAYLLRHGQSDQNKRAAQYLRWAEERGIPVNDDFPITSLTRLLNVEVLEMLGFKVENDDLVPAISSDLAKRLATRIVLDLQSKAVGVNDIFTAEQRADYLKKVRAEAGIQDREDAKSGGNAGKATDGGDNAQKGEPNPSTPGSVGAGSGKGDGQGTGGGTEAGSGRGRGGRTQKPTWDRARLFPRGRAALSVPHDQSKIRNIISELQRLKVSETPIAVAVLLRSLIDISESKYRARHGLPDKQAFHRNVAAVADHMLKRGILTEDQHAVVISRTRDDAGILHIKTLHGYVHSDSFHPEKQTLNVLWDEIGPFVANCWYGVE